MRLQPPRPNYITSKTPDKRMPTLQNHSPALVSFSVLFWSLYVILHFHTQPQPSCPIISGIPRTQSTHSAHQHYSQAAPSGRTAAPLTCSMGLVALTQSVDTLQPQPGSCGWSQWLSADSAIIPASCHVFSYKLHASRVLFSLRILHNLYLFSQCQLDVCFSAWTIFSFQNILQFREVFEQLF